jgi:hypothetical protein
VTLWIGRSLVLAYICCNCVGGFCRVSRQRAGPACQAALEDFFGFPGKLFSALRRLRKDETYAKRSPTVGASKQYNASVPRYVSLIISNSK